MKRAKVVEEKSGHFRSYKYNIVPLSFPGSSEAILELPEVLYFVCFHCFYSLWNSTAIYDHICAVNGADKNCYWCNTEHRWSSKATHVFSAQGRKIYPGFTWLAFPSIWISGKWLLAHIYVLILYEVMECYYIQSYWCNGVMLGKHIWLFYDSFCRIRMWKIREKTWFYCLQILAQGLQDRKGFLW